MIVLQRLIRNQVFKQSEAPFLSEDLLTLMPLCSCSESTFSVLQHFVASRTIFLFFLLPVSHPRLVQLSSGPAGFLAADGAVDRTCDGAEAALRRHGVGQED